MVRNLEGHLNVWRRFEWFWNEENHMDVSRSVVSLKGWSLVLSGRVGLLKNNLKNTSNDRRHNEPVHTR